MSETTTALEPAHDHSLLHGHSDLPMLPGEEHPHPSPFQYVMIAVVLCVITALEIGEIRGVNTSGVLSTLLERHLIKIVGRKNVVGRPFLYSTTKEFLIRFGLNDLFDLPKVEDMAEALGFDPPAGLTERTPPDAVLPLSDAEDEPAEPASDPSQTA